MKDKILCFVCSVNNIETTFNTYYELQDHLLQGPWHEEGSSNEHLQQVKTHAAQDKTT